MSHPGVIGVVRLLLSKGAKINHENEDEDFWLGNALLVASPAGHKKVVQLLMEKGADVNAKGGPFGHALSAASIRGVEKWGDVYWKKGPTLTLNADLTAMRC